MTDKKVEWCSCDAEPYIMAEKGNDCIIGCPKCGKKIILEITCEKK